MPQGSRNVLCMEEFFTVSINNTHLRSSDASGSMELAVGPWLYDREHRLKTEQRSGTQGSGSSLIPASETKELRNWKIRGK